MGPISPVREISQSEFQGTANRGVGSGTGSLNVTSHKPIHHGGQARKDIDPQASSVSDQSEPFPGFDAEYDEEKEEEIERKEIFGKLEKVRVRYDVEVVTKLIVYSGIAWLAMEVIPVLFEYTGLGADFGAGITTR